MNGIYIEDVIQIIIAALLAGAGAIARLLNISNIKHKKHVHGLAVASSCFIAMFAGVIVHYIGRYLGADPNIAYALAGICGWVGPHALDMITAAIYHRIGDLPQTGKQTWRALDDTKEKISADNTEITP